MKIGEENKTQKYPEYGRQKIGGVYARKLPFFSAKNFFSFSKDFLMWAIAVALLSFSAYDDDMDNNINTDYSKNYE